VAWEHPRYNELANALDAAGRNAEALANYDKALQLKPDYAKACYNKGESMCAWVRSPRPLTCSIERCALPRSISRRSKPRETRCAGRGGVMRLLLRTKRRSSCSRMKFGRGNNLGNALLGAGRAAEAIERFQAALRVDPRDAKAHNNLGYMRFRKSDRWKWPSSIMRRRAPGGPTPAEAHASYAVALARVGRLSRCDW